jgi:histidine triad (HIT) family protein
MSELVHHCLICDKHQGLFKLPGGAIYEDEFIYASHAHLNKDQERIYLGWLVLETRRHIPGLAELNDIEAQRLGLYIARLSQALKVVQRAEHVYMFVIGQGVPHLHVHLLPRYPGTPRDYWGVNIDEWPEAPQGNPMDIEHLCTLLREYLTEAERT